MLGILVKVYYHLGFLVLSVGVVAMLVEVFARRVQKSCVPIDEIGNLCMLLLVFGGAPYSFRLGRFIRVRVLYEKLPHTVRHVFDIGHSFLALAFVLYVSYLWFQMTLWNYKTGAYMVALKIPYWVPQLIVLIGWSLLAFSLVECLIEEIGGGDKRKL